MLPTVGMLHSKICKFQFKFNPFITKIAFKMFVRNPYQLKEANGQYYFSQLNGNDSIDQLITFNYFFGINYCQPWPSRILKFFIPEVLLLN